METATTTVIGVLSLVVGSVAKAILDWDDIRPGAPIANRGKALFRQLYLAPDFVLLAVGLLISFSGIQSLLAANNIQPKLGASMAFWFSLLIWTYVGCLLLSVLLWFAAGKGKYVPIAQKERTITSRKGIKTNVVVDSPLWLAGLTSREGMLTLVVGNCIGLACIISFVVFVYRAF